MKSRTALPFTALAIAGALLGVGCSSSDDAAGAKKVKVAITEEGCSPAELKLDAGVTTFIVHNEGAAAVTEFEVLDGKRILGEAENVASGLDGMFTLTLDEGTYTTYCPGGTTSERGTLIVGPGKGVAAVADPAIAARADAAVAAYRTFVEAQTVELSAQSKKFTDAVRANDLEGAKALFPLARAPYERIEPVAESFGDLDPLIDAREGDVPEAEWTGFHRLEKALWVDGDLTGMVPVADQLDADIAKLAELVKSVQLEPAQIANGAVELLGEVTASKITGEEDRYSGTDLYDFEANVQGAYQAYVAVKPILAERAVGLDASISDRFDVVTATLATYKKGDGFVLYPELTPADVKLLAEVIDALGVPLSKVAALVA